MRYLLLFSVLTILTISGSAPAQLTGTAGAPQVKMTLSSESSSWDRDHPAIVKISIENIDKDHDQITLPARIVFSFRDYDKGTTIENPFLYSPVSLTKPYSADKNNCQDDLEPDTTGSRMISARIKESQSKTITLLKNEKKELTLDLNRICWNHVMYGSYPYQTLFTALDRYRPFSDQKYTFWFAMRPQGKSNNVEVNLK